MSKKLQPVRGTQDILGISAQMHNLVVQVAANQSKLYGYEEIITPAFEFSEVFHRTLGDTSDIVSKETYTFIDRDGSSLTLRPEFTASVVRAFISGGLTQTLPQKFFSAGAVFRHERPQKCRYRQFHQINFEFLGAKTALSDVETIRLAADILKNLGLLEVTTLEINTLGDMQSRNAYREKLVSYFSQYIDQLSEDSKVRLHKNPMRILDSKDEGDRAICKDAPLFGDSLSEESKAYYAAVLSGLDELGIEYRKNEKLVRGLDYYSHTVFEFTTDKLGSQGTVLAGGRYDGLVELMGGPSVPAIGFAAGVERLYELMLATGYELPLAVTISLVPLGDNAEKTAQKIAHNLRSHGVNVDYDFGANLPKRMKRADKLKSKYAVIFGDDELVLNQVKIKNMQTGEECAVAIDKISEYVN